MHESPADVKLAALLGQTSRTGYKQRHPAPCHKSGFIWLLSFLRHWIYWILDKGIWFSSPGPHFFPLVKQKSLDESILNSQQILLYECPSLWILNWLKVWSLGKVLMLWMPPSWYKIFLTVKYTWNLTLLFAVAGLDRCQRFHEKFHNLLWKRKQQSWVVVANISYQAHLHVNSALIRRQRCAWVWFVQIFLWILSWRSWQGSRRSLCFCWILF